MFAVAGSSGERDFHYLNTVEEWLEENATWAKADSFLAERRAFFGAVAVPKKFICPE